MVDFLLALTIWTVAAGVFLWINTESFLTWMKEDPVLVSVTAIVSLATTIATSIWIYTFLLGRVLTRLLRKILRLSLVAAGGLVDPYDNPFKIIGIVGSCAMVLLLAFVFVCVDLL